MLIVLDDTLLNGKSYEELRKWILKNFVVLGVHSLPFNTFLKAKANIKTSILHLRKKVNEEDTQGCVFMSISNNIGHDNSLHDTPQRNNLNAILTAYLEWQRTGIIEEAVEQNNDSHDNLECPMQYWLIQAEELTTERFDSFFYCPELRGLYHELEQKVREGIIEVKSGKDFYLVPKISSTLKKEYIDSGDFFKYIEIGDVTSYGLITKYIEVPFEDVPSRGEYQVKKGDILLALNNSSRGTVVYVPDEFDNMICTSGFLVIRPRNEEEGLLLWYCLRSEICRKQIYYLAQTASQPELKIDSWNKYFKIPFPIAENKEKALVNTKKIFKHIRKLSDISNDTFHF